MRAILAVALLLFASSSFAQIAFVNESTAANATATSVTPSEPTSTAEGDVVVAFCVKNGDAGTWTDPADFVEIDQVVYGVGATANTYLGYKVRASTAGSGYAFSHDDSATAMRCTLNTWSGVDGTTPLDVTYVLANHYVEGTDDAGLTAAQPITTVTDGAVVVLHQFQKPDGSFTAVAPTGYTLRSDQQQLNRVTTIASKLVATAGTETPGAWQHTDVDATADSASYTIALRPAATGPTFSTGPTEAPATNGYTISGTITGENATVYAAALNPHETAPVDCTALQALSGTAEIFASEAWTADAADSFALTAAGSRPRNDVHVCAAGASGSTAVTTLADQDRSPDTGQNIVAFGTLSATSPFVLQTSGGNTVAASAVIDTMTNIGWIQEGMLVEVSDSAFPCDPCIVEGIGVDFIMLEQPADSTVNDVTVSQVVYYTPTVAAGDVVEIDDATSGTQAVTLGTDGDIEVTCSPACVGLLSIGYNVQDVSVGGDFDTGPPAWSVGDDVFLLNNTRPNWGEGLEQVILPHGSAMSTIQLSDYCSDAEAQTRHFEVRTGTVPGGTTIASDGEWAGTATTVDRAGVVLDILCGDEGELYSATEIVVYVMNDWTFPTITNMTVSEAATAILADAPWLEEVLSINASFACDNVVANDDIFEQDPAASATVVPFPDVSAGVSTGPTCNLRRRIR